MSKVDQCFRLATLTLSGRSSKKLLVRASFQFSDPRSGLRYYEVTLAFDSTSSFPNPDIANAIGNPSDAAATFAQQRAKLNPTGDAVHRIPKPVLTQETAALGLASDKSRSGNNSPIQLPDGGAAPGDLNRFSPVIDNSRASMRCNVPSPNDPYKFRRPSKGHHRCDGATYQQARTGCLRMGVGRFNLEQCSAALAGMPDGLSIGATRAAELHERDESIPTGSPPTLISPRTFVGSSNDPMPGVGSGFTAMSDNRVQQDHRASGGGAVQAGPWSRAYAETVPIPTHKNLRPGPLWVVSVEMTTAAKHAFSCTLLYPPNLSGFRIGVVNFQTSD
ncbi:hypothetical protein H4582DRAFT_2129936 [Lactarius indigo]|nr:hypothetical protein H4582DRAFT_2129936 [Lactarius indigo]